MNQGDAKNAIKQAAKTVIASKYPDSRLEVHAASERIFTGPLPPPDILKGYNEVVSHGADRIMKMAELEQEHAHKMDNRCLLLVIAGQLLGFLISFSAMAGGFWLVAHDKPLSGFTGFFTGVGILLGGGYLSKTRRVPQSSPKKNRP